MADVISFSCNACGTLYRVPFAQAGQSVKCKQCGAAILVPTQSQMAAPLATDTSVEMNAGAQVLRKETSARTGAVKGRATSGRSVAVPSGRSRVTPPVVPPMPAPPAASGKVLPLMAGGFAVVVLLGVGGFFLLRGGSSAGASNAAPKANTVVAEKPRELDERARILREADDITLSPEAAVQLYQRALSAKLGKTDMLVVARAALNRIYDGNGGKFESSQLLTLAEEMAPLDLKQEVRRVLLLVSNREPELVGGKPNGTFLRVQKMLGREKFDFADLLKRASVLIEAEQEGARELHGEIAGHEAKSPSGWSEPETVAAMQACCERLDKLERALKELEAANPNLLAERAAFNRFRQERAGKRVHWTCAGESPHLLFVQLTDAEVKAGAEGEVWARERAAPVRPILKRLWEHFEKDWVKVLGLKRSLPQGVSEGEREAAPLEVLLVPNFRALRALASDFGENIDNQDVAFYTLKGQRICASIEHLGANSRDAMHLEASLSISILSRLFNFYCAEPLLRDEQQKTRGVMHSFLLNRHLFRCILTPVRCASGIYQVSSDASQRHVLDCTFFDSLPALSRLLFTWRQPYERDAERRAIVSFGGPALCARDLLEITSVAEGAARLRENFRKFKGVSEELAETLSSVDNFQLLGYAYGDALLCFLYNHEQGGKKFYREGLLKFIAMDLRGEIASKGQLKAFEEALGLDGPKWKKLEEDFLNSQK
ncbi:MAG: hypothetical protein DCC64_07330 [Planctomycetota bacterium]|nr:MAG: hypothetical protein DCC64_07330 [Planctomycetota bacterium]